MLLFGRFDPSIVVQIEKAILSGLPLVLVNCDERLDSMVMPLIHHANHGNECSTAEGMYWQWHKLTPISARVAQTHRLGATLGRPKVWFSDRRT